ncbi:hypothetical protein B0H65DRAFT_19172 [Neurospora tetraspora]|uniref:Secreted protein n=1 Tax=Neurospora tetraspora TaxID=94610 RepID=A0AAE0JN05_9PEZI|nr:hypothetical protein B0H65DRAFT_19172 [Neurospora tetraspora]
MTTIKIFTMAVGVCAQGVAGCAQTLSRDRDHEKHLPFVALVLVAVARSNLCSTARRLDIDVGQGVVCRLLPPEMRLQNAGMRRDQSGSSDL